MYDTEYTVALPYRGARRWRLEDSWTFYDSGLAPNSKMFRTLTKFIVADRPRVGKTVILRGWDLWISKMANYRLPWRRGAERSSFTLPRNMRIIKRLFPVLTVSTVLLRAVYCSSGIKFIVLTLRRRSNVSLYEYYSLKTDLLTASTQYPLQVVVHCPRRHREEFHEIWERLFAEKIIISGGEVFTLPGLYRFFYRSRRLSIICIWHPLFCFPNMSIENPAHKRVKPGTPFETEHTEAIRTLSCVSGNPNYIVKNSLRTEGDGADHSSYNTVRSLHQLIFQAYLA
jgi:hypothetical protein